MSITTANPHLTGVSPLSPAAKAAAIAEVLDLDADHDIDLAALVSDLESDGYTLTADITDEAVDEILTRVAAYSTAPIVY